MALTGKEVAPMLQQIVTSRRLLILALAMPFLVPAWSVFADPATRNESARELRQATFQVRNELKVMLPEGAQRVRIWFALPQDDPAQQVSSFQVEAPYPYRIERDSEGNQVLYIEADDPKEKELIVRESFTLNRSEVRSSVDATKARPLSEADRASLERYLGPNKYVVIDDNIRLLADQIVGNEINPVLAARKLYDWVLHNVDYWVKDPKTKKASPVGSTTYCLIFRTGNCTDFESLWTSLARAKGIPARIVYGSFFKPDLEQKDLDQSYHCWAQFYAPGLGWISHDVAVADLYAGDFTTTTENEVLVRRTTADGTYGNDLAKINYYFGNLDERRVTWSTGRDLILNPRQDGDPVNALPKAYVEIDGKVHPEGKGWVRKLTYRELSKEKVKSDLSHVRTASHE
jgi:transglutaminase-like putative cysteine protease